MALVRIPGMFSMLATPTSPSIPFRVRITICITSHHTPVRTAAAAALLLPLPGCQGYILQQQETSWLGLFFPPFMFPMPASLDYTHLPCLYQYGPWPIAVNHGETVFLLITPYRPLFSLSSVGVCSHVSVWVGWYTCALSITYLLCLMMTFGNIPYRCAFEMIQNNPYL
ncbi:hypothetical protein QR685DRAFT_180112 [Neurospora intermedia]|uniref:Uncharacterized protein n=1 Tax=Neurospora intermedia TaxID=5142 RepID=A0ABR3DLQ4_NEUIN